MSELEATYTKHPGKFVSCDLCGASVIADVELYAWGGEMLRTVKLGFIEQHTSWHKELAHRLTEPARRLQQMQREGI